MTSSMSPRDDGALRDSAVPAPMTPAGLAAPAASAPASPLTLDLLAWVARRPRSYAETMAAWRTSCPRFPIWEDAIDDGLIHLESGAGTRLSESRVVLTSRGHAVLHGT